MTNDALDKVTACLKALPTKIKIGAYDWKVVLLDGDEGLLGQADFTSLELRFWPENLTSAGHAVGVALHECLHVIFDNHRLGPARHKRRREYEEIIVLGFESGLITLYRDNPRLLPWMKKWLAVAST